MSWPSLIILASVGECEHIASRIRSFGAHWDPVIESETLHWNGHSYSLDFSGRVLADFEPEEIRDISQKVEDLFAIYVSCESMDAARALLPQVLAGFSGLIDTNHGDVLEFSEFVRLIENHPRWDWRRATVAQLLDQADGA